MAVGHSLGNLHGGCVATLIDLCSSMAILVSGEKMTAWRSPGISTELAVSYIAGAPEGAKLRVENELLRSGKTLANLYTKVYNEDGRLCYSGTHTKFCLDSKM
ncbi:hypothetical protein INT44_006614 [Umbelopsis vinacea]|uniref:Thioesterase domain-containing protein n=1 Tax=Umbelopsis vinacea TaxID=44442 RepID=A0A8H7U7U0_9FUNG|nr:hypothetical protein INT44_006614 [Umbelopsis vinacea]